MRQPYTLYQAIQDAKYPKESNVEPLTEGEIDSLVKMLTDHCRQETKDLIWRRLALYLSMLPALSDFEKIQIRPHVKYFAFQSSTDEIRRTRELLKEG